MSDQATATPPVHLRRSTIHDVARESGVSIKTVSRVARREANVSEETRKLVQDAMDRLHYRPAMAARSTVSARSFMIGLVFDNPNAYSAQLLLGAQQAAKEHGFHLLIESLGDGEADVADQLEHFVIQSNLAGLILPPPISDNPAVIAMLTQIGRPFVRIAPRDNDGSGIVVRIDDETAAAEATRHLIELGHTRIAFVEGRRGTYASQGRLAGYRRAMAEAGLAVEDWQVAPGAYGLRDGIEAGPRLLDRAERPTAVFAANDQMAVGVMIAAFQRGLKIPEDLSIVGFDDVPLAGAMWPALTTVRQPVGQIGAAAVQQIVRQSREEGSDREGGGSIVVPYELIRRDSVRKLAG